MKKGILFTLGLLAAVLIAVAACGDTDGADSMTSEEESAGAGADVDTPLADDRATSLPEAIEEQVVEEEASADEAATAPQPGEGGEPTLGAGSLGRKIIQSATIELEVEDVIRGFSSATRIAGEAGGFVAASNVYSEDDERYATLTIRVPAEEYSSALERLRGLGEVASEGSNTSDVTEEYTDLQSRLRNLEAVEAQYVQLLGQATNINDILVVQDRLNITRAEIEQIQGRLNVIDNMAELASIEVFLSPPSAPMVDSGEGWSLLAPAEAAVENSYDVMRDLAAGLIAAGVYGLWLLPLAIAGFVVARVLSRRGQAAAS